MEVTDRDTARRMLADPTTTEQDLAQVAARFPDLSGQVAAHPAADSILVDWLLAGAEPGTLPGARPAGGARSAGRRTVPARRRPGDDPVELSSLFPDRQLARCVAQAVGVPPVSRVTPLWLARTGPLGRAGQLSCAGAGVMDLRGVELLEGVEALDLRYNRIYHIRPLASMGGLRLLGLSWNPLDDVGPLATLTNLFRLHLHGCRVRRVGPLATLTALRFLDLRGNPVEDLSALNRLAAGGLRIVGP